MKFEGLVGLVCLWPTLGVQAFLGLGFQGLRAQDLGLVIALRHWKDVP